MSWCPALLQNEVFTAFMQLRFQSSNDHIEIRSSCNRFLLEKKGPYICLQDIAQNPLTFGEPRTYSTVALRFSGTHIRKFCVFTFPFMWNVNSSTQNSFSTIVAAVLLEKWRDVIFKQSLSLNKNLQIELLFLQWWRFYNMLKSANYFFNHDVQKIYFVSLDIWTPLHRYIGTEFTVAFRYVYLHH